MADDLAALLAQLPDHLEALTDRVVASFREEIPAYSALPDPELRPGVRSNIERAIDALRRGGEPTAAEAEGGRLLGEHRAQQGVPVEALLQAHRIGVREAIALSRELAARQGIDAEVVLELATRAWAWVDVITLSAARGHREQELDLASQAQQQRAHLLRGLLHGLLEDAGLRTAALTEGIEPGDLFVPLCAAGPPGALRQVERAINEAAAKRNVTALLAPLDEGLAGILGTRETSDAEALAEAATAGVEVVVAVGVPARPPELAAAYALTRRAMEAARGLGRTGLARLPEVSLHAAVLGQPEISTLLHERYVAPLERLGDFGRELLVTLEVWFAHGMRTDETAAALPAHPNTLRHRLRRVEELTGMSLGTTEARFELWWALNARRLVVHPHNESA